MELAFEGVNFFDRGVGRQSAGGALYHTATTRDLTERYGDVQLKIGDMETAICNQVAQRLGQAGTARAIRAATAAAAELDCLVSLAEAATELRLTRPKLTADNSLNIRGGRHILAEMVVKDTADFIPNDTAMGSETGRIHVITGPNFSGKSAYAKQVAIIVFLAHVGSFVPAEYAEIGLTDRIFTRVTTRECVTVPQSTFMIDLSQVAAMLRLSTPRSLLIIDEFGKGTLAADGVGLLCGALAHLAARRMPPRVVLTTHFTEVLNPRYLPRTPQLSFYTMSVLVESESEESSKEEGNQGKNGATALQRPLGGRGLVFLYRLTEGQATPSFGVQCAELAGVCPEVVHRAGEVIACMSRGAPMERAAFPAMASRNTTFRALVQRLMLVDTEDTAAVHHFMAEVAKEVAPLV